MGGTFRNAHSDRTSNCLSIRRLYVPYFKSFVLGVHRLNLSDKFHFRNLYSKSTFLLKSTFEITIKIKFAKNFSIKSITSIINVILIVLIKKTFLK